MRLSPHFPTWYLTEAGRSLVGLREFEAAVAEFDEALERDPVDIFLAWTLAGKAEALVGLGDRDQALRVVETLRQRVPWYTLSYLGNNLQFKGQKVVDEKLAMMRELGLPEN